MSTGIASKDAVMMEEIPHIQQSIQDILVTQLGERVMRREYGSWIRYLVDAPLDPVTVMDIYASVVGAIRRWEPRVIVEQVQAAEIEPTGRITFHISCRHAETGQPISLADVKFDHPLGQ